MPFPFSIAGSIDIAASSPAALARLCTDVVRALEAQRATVTLREPAHYKFRVPLIRGFFTHGDVVAPLDGIEFWVESVAEHGAMLRYRLSLTRLALLATLMLAVASLTVWRQFAASAYLLPVMWLWLVGGNYTVAWFRARTFFRRAAASNAETFAPTAT